MSTSSSGPTAGTVVFGLRRAAPNGEIARVLLAFLASAGLFYVNIMPALVDGLIQGAGYSNRQAGLIGSSNVYGAALGALAVVFFVRRIPWRPVACVLLGLLIAMDLVSMVVRSFELVAAARFAHGVVGGMLVGVGFSIIARTREPDRTFGYLLLVQFGLGGLGLMLLPPLVPHFGTPVLFWSLIVFSGATLAMIPFLEDYPPVETQARVLAAGGGVRVGPLVLSLLATFLFQAGNMAVFAYVIGLGEAAGLSTSFISPSLAAASWVGIGGAAVVILLSTRYGRTLPLVAAVVLTAAFTWALHFSSVPTVYLLANCIVGATWSMGIPYLLGMCAAFDGTGQMAAIGGFASKMGLATGPMLAALVIGEGDYALVVNLGAAIIAATMVLAWVPARLLDGERGSG